MSKSSLIANIEDFPVVPNICNQELRELISLTNVSVAHVVMQSNAVSLLHSHQKMWEIYYILSGEGIFYQDNNRFQVAKWSHIVLPPTSTHKLQNTWTETLEHLVFAVPPFDPTDVRELHEDPTLRSDIAPLQQKEKPSYPAKDGWVVNALLTPRECEQTNISLAEWYLPGYREAKIHHHNKGEELYYVVSGKGIIHLDRTITSIGKNDIISIPKKTAHGLANSLPEDMEIICLCTPPYQDSDFKHSSSFKKSSYLH